MKSKLSFLNSFFVALALLGFFFTGCKSTPKVDWESRVGIFTYDQAVAELGPPDKSTKLSDGKTVADWVTGRSGGSGFSVGTGFYGSHTGVGVSQSIGGGYRDKVLRLTFGSDGKLTAWSKNY